MIALDTLQEWLDVAPDTDPELLTDLEVRAVAFLEEITGRYFGPVMQHVEYLNGTGTRDLWLKELPIVQTGPPLYDIAVEQETTFAVWTAVTGWVVRDYRLLNPSRWIAGMENFRVMYWAGYAAGTEPEPIKQAVMDLVSLKYNNRGQEAMRSESLDGYSYTMGDIEMIPGLASTIDFWRWVRVA